MYNILVNVQNEKNDFINLVEPDIQFSKLYFRLLYKTY